jgi:hypothetical protein
VVVVVAWQFLEKMNHHCRSRRHPKVATTIEQNNQPVYWWILCIK